MQHHHIEVIPGESVRVGNLIVTLLYVDGDHVALAIEDPDNTASIDPMDLCDSQAPLALMS